MQHKDFLAERRSFVCDLVVVVAGHDNRYLGLVGLDRDAHHRRHDRRAILTLADDLIVAVLCRLENIVGKLGTILEEYLDELQGIRVRGCRGSGFANVRAWSFLAQVEIQPVDGLVSVW
jgi:hypothetical protein